MLDDIKQTLWVAANKGRSKMGAAEYKYHVLNLRVHRYQTCLSLPDATFHEPIMTLYGMRQEPSSDQRVLLIERLRRAITRLNPHLSAQLPGRMSNCRY